MATTQSKAPDANGSARPSPATSRRRPRWRAKPTRRCRILYPVGFTEVLEALERPAGATAEVEDPRPSTAVGVESAEVARERPFDDLIQR